MTKETQLSRAILIATMAHDCQYDKGGKPYILHPLHLMNQFMFDIELATIAVLHDVIEDSNYTLFALSDAGFSKRVIEVLFLLTHQKNVPYEEYIDNMCDNYDAIRIKRKDLEHNSDITRLKGVTEKDLARMEKYHKAFIKLGEARAKFKGE